jgi:predicted nucleic acid-binding protein
MSSQSSISIARALASRSYPDRVIAEVWQLADVFDPPPLPAAVSRDPDDDAILALAVAAQADFMVSGDADLLVLGVHDGIPIVGPAQALATSGGA